MRLSVAATPLGERHCEHTQLPERHDLEPRGTREVRSRVSARPFRRRSGPCLLRRACLMRGAPWIRDSKSRFSSRPSQKRRVHQLLRQWNPLYQADREKLGERKFDCGPTNARFSRGSERDDPRSTEAGSWTARRNSCLDSCVFRLGRDCADAPRLFSNNQGFHDRGPQAQQTRERGPQLRLGLSRRVDCWSPTPRWRWPAIRQSTPP